MSKGIFTAVSGAIAQSAKLDTISNNLANVNTPGFKRDQQAFREYLSAYEKEPSTIEVPRVPASIESFYDMQGGDKSYVDLNGTYTDFSQGNIKTTGNPLDAAIEGKGLFEVATPAGVRFTRSGNFSVDGEGRLVTKQGYPVLTEGAPGSDPQSRMIQLQGKGQITLSSNGEVYQNGQSQGKISIVVAGKPDALLKAGNNLYTLKDNMDAQLTTATDAKLHQGSLEGSNVNIVQEMTDMIATTRIFESTQKGIQAYDQMTQKAVNDISKLR